MSSPVLLALGAHYLNTGDYKTAVELLTQVVDSEDASNEKRLRFLILSLQRVKTPKTQKNLSKDVEHQGLNEEAQKLVNGLVPEGK